MFHSNSNNEIFNVISLKKIIEISVIVLMGLLLGSVIILVDKLYMQIALILSIIIVMSILFNNKYIFLYTIIAPIFMGISRNFNSDDSNILGYMDEALILACIVLGAIRVFNTKHFEVGKFKSVFISLFLFSAVALSSTFFNEVSMLIYGNYFSTFLKPFILILVIYNFLDANDFKFLISILIITAVLQVLLSSLQFFTYGNSNILVGSEIKMIEDSATGSFGEKNAHLLGHFMTIMMIFCSSVYLYTSKSKWIALFTLFTYCFILTFTEQDYIFSAMYFSLIILFGINLSLFKRLFLTTLFISAILCLLFYKADSLTRYIDYITDPSNLKHSGKAEGFAISRDIIFNDFPVFLIGTGPASFSSGLASKYKGKLYEKHIGYKIEEIKSTVDFAWSSFTSILTETGLLGFAFYYGSFFLIIIHLLKNIRITKDDWERGIILTTVSTCFFILYLSFIINIFEFVSIMFPVAVLISYSFKLLHAVKKA